MQIFVGFVFFVFPKEQHLFETEILMYLLALLIKLMCSSWQNK